MMSGVKVRLGDLLVQQGLIDEPQLMSALAEQRQTGRKLGATLIAMELVTEKQLLELLSTHLNVPLIDIDHFNVNPAAVKLLPEVQARRYRALVLEDRGDKLLVGMSDPADLTAVDNLGEILPKPIEVAVVSEQQLFGAYDSFYRRTDEIASFAQQLANEYRDEQEFELTAGLEDEQDTAVARLLQSIFEDAVQAKASDIHIEP
ncbi:MAG TPA: MSHA biogenesis protein MshE, partial [Alteromonas sp.]|nr:MSHA biogenesis protein MshE [Alteromonas sp.]